MCLYTYIGWKHNPTTCDICDCGVLYQQAMLPFFFPLLSSQCNISPFLSFWMAFEQTAWTDICINILLQCSSDLTTWPLYSSYSNRQINLSAVFGFLFLFVAHSFNFSNFFRFSSLLFISICIPFMCPCYPMWFRLLFSLFNEYVCITHDKNKKHCLSLFINFCLDLFSYFIILDIHNLERNLIVSIKKILL